MRAGRSTLFAAACLLVLLIATTTSSARVSLVFAPPVRLGGVIAGSVFLPTGTEPRVAVGPNGTRYAMTTIPPDGQAAVYASKDGRSWSGRAFPAAVMPGPDVDLVVTRTGRIVALVLDALPLRVRAYYSDDRGSTWTESAGASLVDQDRPWLAVGPDDPETRQPRVYLLTHNLFTGVGVHQVFVATSRDGGASFGLPVGVMQPSEQAFLDSQCAGVPGPSGIAVDEKTGRIYVAWGTRTSALGGCGAAISPGPFQFSIESPSRIWVATSPDGSDGSWRTTLAVDDSAVPNTVGALFSPITVDAAGNVYVVYPESPRPYPDYSGAAVRYRWAPPGLSRWSRAVTVARAGGPGALTTQVVAGARGKLAFSYLKGVPSLNGPARWFATAAMTLDGLSRTPHLREVVLAPFPSYTGTATALAGACGSGPLGGLQQGVTCPRAADNFGMVVDATCRIVVAWPAIENAADGTHPGTWVSQQIAGDRVC
jgi:hypothetical protein